MNWAVYERRGENKHAAVYLFATIQEALQHAAKLVEHGRSFERICKVV